MKANRILTLCGLAVALCLSAGNLVAQENTNQGGGRRGDRQGGGQGGGGNGGGRGNFDPAQWQQQRLQETRDRLGFTNDTDWNAVQPLIQKVWDARREIGFGGMGRRGGGGGGSGSGQGNGGQSTSNPEADALRSALEANAPAAQIKAALEKYRAARKDKEAKLEKAQADLRKVLTTKQEAQAVLLGLLN